jgi:imidazole glycerol-phosphate synthase subunit HisH
VTANAQVVIVDYGMGNVLSVARAVEHCGGEPALSADPAVIATAPRVILPGVGAFRDGMRGLAARNLVEPLRDYARQGRPILGICLGMQMLFDESEEFGRHDGLGVIPGRVQAIANTGADGTPHKLPHIAWTPLELPDGAPETWWENSILNTIPAGTAAYFLHSFTAVPSDDRHRLADAHYNGRRISAAVRNGRVTGTQFHPEKSAALGLRMLRQFMQLN